MLVMEAAGYDVVLVETVGVGQSEFVVADMVDIFLMLTLARTGDQLQGIKRGILEIVDVIAVNKADGTHEQESVQAARELAGALRLLRSDATQAPVPVLTCSALNNVGLTDIWQHITAHRDRLDSSGELAAKRRRQLVEWTRAMVRERLLSRLGRPGVREVVLTSEAAVLAGELTADQAAAMIVDALDRAPDQRLDQAR